jgi:hypothetical protein
MPVDAEVGGSSLPLAETWANLQAPSELPKFAYIPNSDLMVDTERNERRYLSCPPNIHTSFDTPLPSLPMKKGRYYSQALSHDDRHTLSHGVVNHNLKEWTPKDMVLHHESRKGLVPHGHGISNLDKLDALVSIQQEKELSQEALDKVCDLPKVPHKYLKIEEGHKERLAHALQASQSMHDLRFTSASPKQMTRTFSFDESPKNTHVRAASSGDYFARQARPARAPRRRLREPSPAASDASGRVCSPLTKSFPQHNHNPEVTFDAFLAPHTSGKGEAFRGAINAKNNAIDWSTNSTTTSSSSRDPSPAPKGKSLRKKLSKLFGS